uniref:Uncharacterized protein n=1 Tax=Ditylenchus dipsaci TaxID=166011 RepID=A0A915DBD0_9BILA
MQQEILSKRLRDDDNKETKRDQSLTNSSSSTSSLSMKPNATFLHPSPRSLLTDQFPQEVLSPPKPPKSGARRQVSRTNSGNGTSQPSSNKSRSYVSRVSRLASTIASVASGQSGSFETESGSREVESPPLSDFVHSQGTSNSFVQTGTQILSPHQFQSGPDSPAPTGTPPRGVKRSLQAPQRPALKGPRLEEDLQGPPSQCRIHVQNPPNAIDCDFPPTETTIHVVQQPRYQDGRFASNSQRSGAYEGNANPNVFRTEEGKAGNAVISVQQHPSVAHIQQQRGVTGYLETRPANYRVVESGQKGHKRLGDPSPELVHHVIVQSSNTGLSFQPNQSPNVDNNYTGGVSHQLLPASMRGAPPGPMNSTIPPSQPLIPNARQNKTSMSRITPAVYAAPGGAMIFANNNPMVITNPNVCGNPRNDVQLAAVRQKDVEFRKYSIKLYHLQRTIKALVYKNGALSDELARLNQRIYTVTEERKMLAKRLQHHERNRIRRIQTQHRKAAAAARKAVLIHQTSEADKTTNRANIRRPTEAGSVSMQPLSVKTTEPDHSLFATMKSPSSIASSSGTNYSPRISQSPRPAFSGANLLTTVATTSIINSHSQSSSIMSSANADDDLMAAGRSRSNSPDLGRATTTVIILHRRDLIADLRLPLKTVPLTQQPRKTLNNDQRDSPFDSCRSNRKKWNVNSKKKNNSKLRASPKVGSASSVASEQKANNNTSMLDNHISPRNRASRAASRSSVDPAGNAMESNILSTSSKRSIRSKDRSVDKTDVDAQSDDVLAIVKSVSQQNCHGDLVQQQPHQNSTQAVSAHLRSAVPTRRQARRNNGEV